MMLTKKILKGEVMKINITLQLNGDYREYQPNYHGDS